MLENEDSPPSLDQILILQEDTSLLMLPGCQQHSQPLAALGAGDAADYLSTAPRVLIRALRQCLSVTITMAEESLLENKCLELCHKETVNFSAGRVWTDKGTGAPGAAFPWVVPEPPWP